jgi:predicted CxxxxCH...CXXCH cytochrome family protein
MYCSVWAAGCLAAALRGRYEQSSRLLILDVAHTRQPLGTPWRTGVLHTGQEAVRDLEAEVRANGIDPHIIGGMSLAGELTAKCHQTGRRTGSKAVSYFSVSPNWTNATKSLTCKELHPEHGDR